MRRLLSLAMIVVVLAVAGVWFATPALSQSKVVKIGDLGSKVGVFLYCQQHAREWATALTCIETAEQLLRNYAIDPHTRELVDNLDIFILPSSNPDGAHYSLYNSNGQRRNMTNHCVEGGLSTDDPFAENFWSPRVNPGTGVPYVNSDPASRNAWGVDLNRNNTAGTIFDGYIGASYSCTSDVYAGRSEASEPIPYQTHEPAAGRPEICVPVFMKVWAGSWLICSVCIERITQMSSAISPIFGSSVDSSWPDFP